MELPFDVPFDLQAISDFATSHAFEFWIYIAINLIVSTIVGGVLLVVLLGLFSKKFGERINPANAFLVVVIANVVNYLLLLGFLSPFLGFIPYIGYVFPLLMWILLIKLFFPDLGFVHALIASVIFYLITIFVVPIITGYVVSFLPSFG